MVMALSLSGCSFVFVRPPPPDNEPRERGCTESRAAPVLDAIFAALQGANLVYAVASSDAEWANTFGGDPPLSRGAAVPLYALATAVGTFGAYYGFHNTGVCREAHVVIRVQNNPRESDESTVNCRRERYRVLSEAKKIENQYDRMKMIESAPRCGP